MQLSWVESLVLSPDPHAAARRDWYPFFETGHRLLAGDLGAVYPRTFDRGYLWLYPPYCIYLTAPLGVLPEWGAYALCAAVGVAAVAGALAFLPAALPARGADHPRAALVLLPTMALHTPLALGQGGA